MMQKTTQEFISFIKKYGVIGLAIGIVIGAAVKDLTDSLVANLINPFLAKFTAETNLYSVEVWDIRIGAFVNDIISFLVLMAVVFFSMKLFINRFLTEEEKSKLQ